MNILRGLAAALFLALSLFNNSPANSQNIEIGSVSEIRLALYGTVSGGNSERLYKNDHVFADELIETVKKSSAQIRFLNDTDLWLGASSQLTLDSFIYDPDAGTGEMIAELGTGLFRFVTGNMPNEGFEILTPGRGHRHSRDRFLSLGRQRWRDGSFGIFRASDGIAAWRWRRPIRQSG